MRLRFLILLSLFIASQSCKTKQEVDTHKTYHIIDSNTIEGFFGIKWGEPIKTAKLQLLQRNPEAEADLAIEDSLSLFFIPHIHETIAFELVDTKMDYLFLRFTSRGFCSASVTFTYLTADQATTMYLKLRESLETKYGEPSRLEPEWRKLAAWESSDSCAIYLSQDDVANKHKVFLSYTNRVLERNLEAEEAVYYQHIEVEKTEYENRIKQQIKEKNMKDL